jgi:competence protein ComEA
VSPRLRALGAALLLLLADPALAKKKPLAPGERIDLNRAGVAELMRLPGIGRRKAEAIAAHRARQPFRSPSEVTQVEGIGRLWFERNQDRLSAGTPAVAPPAPRPPRAP